MLVVVTILAAFLCHQGQGSTEDTRGLLYLLKYGYLAPRNGTSALLTEEGLQGERDLIYQSLLGLPA